jgi:hypothetical protein
MTLNTQNVKELLKEFNFKKLFIEELGWDRHSFDLSIPVKEDIFSLHAIAQKRGVQIFICDPETNGCIPEYNKRKKIEREITKSAHEHLIIYQDKDKTRQIWQWVARRPGKVSAYREYTYEKGQSFESLIHKLDAISFTITDEEGLTLPLVTFRLKDALDRDRVTKQFYDRFAKENEKFYDFIYGITISRDKEWYSSVMLNRLMFIYFIQKKGFLDNDRNYLRNHLEVIQKERGRDKFYSFYRYFLLKLFHKGLGSKNRTPELEKVLGKIPYLNGGLFQEHLIEQKYENIEIPDKAFKDIFDFFDQFEWYLDDRPLREGNEINPDVLGYIFEKFINRKEMGAYYTKEDITNYICCNTILPFIFDSAKIDCKIAFDWDTSVWNYLKENPDRYIPNSIQFGINKQLPEKISKGLDNVAERNNWNELAEEDFALPKEVWRETIARKRYYDSLKNKLSKSEIKSINDCVTYNLNLKQFIQDVIENSEGPELIRSFYKCITRIKVLDPAVGSGAFLFAALNILEPLYEACLNRMQIFIHESKNDAAFSDFKNILKQVDSHPNRDYFIFKSIILNNLYGVDIMDEAIEICKLRLFLKLVSVIENVNNVEALPDIDFNIRTGNTLIGYSSRNDVREAITSLHGKQKKLVLEEDEKILNKLEKTANETDNVFNYFKRIQNEPTTNEKEIVRAKGELSSKLILLENELNEYLCYQYGIDKRNTDSYNKWYDSHRPFHWFVDFYNIMTEGGFDIIIGNPPYVRSSKVNKNYEVKGYLSGNCPDIYAWMLERTCNLLNSIGRSGMILPLSLGFSDDFLPIRKVIFNNYSTNWFSSFGRIPSALFSHDIRVRNTIHLGSKLNNIKNTFSTRLHRWFEEERPFLFDCIQYSLFSPDLWDLKIPKINTQKLTDSIELCLQKNKNNIGKHISRKETDNYLYFKKTAYNWLNFCKKIPPCFDQDGCEIEQTQFDRLNIIGPDNLDILYTLLNGKFVFIYWIIVGDDFHVAKWMFSNFPLGLLKLSKEDKIKLKNISIDLENSMSNAVSFKFNAGKKVGNYNLAKCRNVTDISDSIFSKYLGFDEVLEDFELYYSQIVSKDFDE